MLEPEPSLTVKLLIVEGETVTESLSAAAEEDGPLTAWSVATIRADSALYSAIVPPAEETPLVKVIVVSEPKLVALPVFEVTVGLVASGAAFAPEKRRV